MANSKVTLPEWPDAPPFESLRAALDRYKVRVDEFKLHLPEDSSKSFTQFLRWSEDDLSGRSTGGAHDLMVAYGNALSASDLTGSMRDKLLEFERPPQLNQRTQVAFLHVIAAAQTVNASLLTHIRSNEWYECATLTILRTALELCAKAVYVTMGAGDEPERWHQGPKLSTAGERRAAQLPIARSVSSINSLVRQREPSAPAPDVVYGWLCGFTHLDSNAFEFGPTHEDAYAAFAYVAWVCAVTAEHVTGVRDVAVYPTRWPDVLPWDRPRPPP